MNVKVVHVASIYGSEVGLLAYAGEIGIPIPILLANVVFPPSVIRNVNNQYKRRFSSLFTPHSSIEL